MSNGHSFSFPTARSLGLSIARYFFHKQVGLCLHTFQSPLSRRPPRCFLPTNLLAPRSVEGTHHPEIVTVPLSFRPHAGRQPSKPFFFPFPSPLVTIVRSFPPPPCYGTRECSCLFSPLGLALFFLAQTSPIDTWLAPFIEFLGVTSRASRVFYLFIFPFHLFSSLFLFAPDRIASPADGRRNTFIFSIHLYHPTASVSASSNMGDPLGSIDANIALIICFYLPFPSGYFFFFWSIQFFPPLSPQDHLPS